MANVKIHLEEDELYTTFVQAGANCKGEYKTIPRELLVAYDNAYRALFAIRNAIEGITREQPVRYERKARKAWLESEEERERERERHEELMNTDFTYRVLYEL